MSSTANLAAGTLVAGRYRIEEPLAGEGSGAVYRAADTRLDRAVALRALAPAEGGGVSQGRAAARLVHPNVARVLDFGADAELGMEYVVADLGTGGSLAALLAQRGAPPLPLALRMVQEAAAGMAAAHRAGLVHGDLHPGVLWLSRDEGRLRVQVLGLGLNPAGGPPPRATARYAAPERLRRARELGPAADVFSLGVIAHEVFAGLPAEWNRLLVQMVRGQAVVAPSLLESRPELPAHVAHAVRRAMAAEPASRWPDAGDLAAHLIADAATPAVAADAPAVPVPAPVRAVPAQIVQPAPIVAGPIASASVTEPEPARVTEPESIQAAPVAEAEPASAASAFEIAAPLAAADPVVVDEVVAELVAVAASTAEFEAVPVQADDSPVAVDTVEATLPLAAPLPDARAAEPVAQAPEPKPARQPLVAGRRGKPAALAATDLAEQLYIPPALEPRTAAAPVAAPEPIPAPLAAAASAPERPAAAVPAEVLERSAPAGATLAAPLPVAAYTPAAAVAAGTALVPAAGVAVEVSALPERRRRNGLHRLGPSSGSSRRGLLAAGIAVGVLLVGGVVAGTLLAGGGVDAPVAQNLASRALATAGGAPDPVGTQAAPADSEAAEPTAPSAAAAEPAAALTPEAQRAQDAERRRMEEQRRQQQRQQDSLRQAQLAARAAQTPAVAPQQVALQTAPTPAAPVAAQPVPQRTQPPATAAAPPAAAAPEPARPAADPSRVYGAEELDSRPALTNGAAFRSAVTRSYPATLRGSNTWGNAVVSFVVLPDGRVDRGSVVVNEASQPAFRPAAVAAIASARFNPARVGGRPVRTTVSMPITWQPGGRDDE